MSSPARADEAAPATNVRARVSRDSLWLASGYAATAGSGFVFWLLAAVWIPQAQLGIEASVLAAVMAAAALASNGPGSALVVMLPLGGPAARETLRRALTTTAVLSLVSGVVAGAVVAGLLPSALPPVATVCVVATCSVAWALFNVQAQALAGASDARATLIVNGSANLLKLGLLALLAFAAHATPLILVLATILPAIAMTTVSLTVLIPRALRRDNGLSGSVRRWDGDLARAFRRFAFENAIAVGIVMCAGLSLSFLVTTLASPVEGAIFAIAFQFSVALDLVGVAVATALARSAVGAFAHTAELAHGYALKVSIAVGALGATAAIATPLMFLLLGRGYPPLYGMAVVGILAAASAIRPGYDIWSALSRARHRVRPVLVGNAVWLLTLLAFVLLLVPRWGALGASTAVVCAALVLTVIGIVGLRHAHPHRAAPLPSKGAPA
ncbi:lipopolysaccharide biosynthesis protein [Microbacterium trichothecenolyticum]|uniref:lipopolysaccharide biosynthesis protein n=1 Tax=Microbacterium trichothecenolyticum TaxID=69370 RepID=UPI0035BE96CD